MASNRVKTVALVAGVGTLALAIVVVLFWQQLYYALYPEARLWGKWVPAPDGSREGSQRGRGNANPRVLSAYDISVEFPPDGGASMKARILYLANPPRYEGEVASRDLSLDVPKDDCHIGRSRLTFPNVPVLLDDSIDEPSREQPHSVTIRYRFRPDGRLVLESEEGFFLDGSNSLTLRRAIEGD